MDIVPYHGVGPLLFGMKPQEVEAVMGSPVAKMKNFRGELRLVYKGLNVEFAKDGLVEVTMDKSPTITFQGRLLQDVNKEDVIKQCENAIRGHGSIILLDLGIAIPSDDNLLFPLTAFASGRLDPLLSFRADRDS